MHSILLVNSVWGKGLKETRCQRFIRDWQVSEWCATFKKNVMKLIVRL